MRPALLPWALSGGAAVSVGFARFGYALILPAMQTDLQLSYAQAGWLNTSNSLGYLLGSILAVLLVARIGNHRLFVAGMLTTTLGLFLNGLTDHLLILNLIRFLTGAGAAWAFICGGVLASMLGDRAMIIYFGGGGSGMLITGAGLPWLFELTGPAAWPWAWILTALVCLPVTVAALAAARYSPQAQLPGRERAGWPWQACSKAFLAYFMFGLGYIAYMTFIVAWVRDHLALQLPMAVITSGMWSVLGGMSLLAPTVWKRLFQRHGRSGLPMATTMTTLAVGATLPLIAPGVAGALMSAALVGVSVLMVPSAITGFIKGNLPAASWGSALAVATTLFAIGQAVGPVTAGWISDQTSSLSTGLAASACFLLIGALLAGSQRRLPITSAVDQPAAG